MTVSTDIYREPLAYRSAEIGPDGTINLFRVVDILQETAGKHADRLGFGMEVLGNAGTTWALTKLHIKLQRQLMGGQSYTVQTWPSGVHRLWAIRRYLILDSEECVVGQAVSNWMILDQMTHRPQRLPDTITQRVWPEPPIPEPDWTNFDDLKELTHSSSEFDVRLNEIDINNHVNNAHYLAWAMNAAAIDNVVNSEWSAVEAELLFEAESKFGDTIRVMSGYRESGETLQSSHHVQRIDPSTRVSRVNILWQKGLE